MSPVISNVSFIEAIQAARSWTSVLEGTTSATSLPWRVMRTGLRVRRTSSSIAKHFALNCEIETSVRGLPSNH